MKAMSLAISVCPSCGGRRVKKVRQSLSGAYRGCKYAIPALDVFACPDCGEKIYDRQAMQEIEAHSPAFSRVKRRRKSA
jgi:YgiT-type zinc finger domain-containing protein